MLVSRGQLRNLQLPKSLVLGPGQTLPDPRKTRAGARTVRLGRAVGVGPGAGHVFVTQATVAFLV